MRLDRRLLITLTGALALGLFLGYLVIRLLSGQPLFGAASFISQDLQAPTPLDDFTLIDASGEAVSLRDFRDQVVVLYFGYTYCPDVCPATMADLARALEQLGSGEQEEVQVIMVTVDPERDKPERLQEYVEHFDPSFLGLSGSPDQIREAAAVVGVYFAKQEGTVASGYLVDHTATVAVLDRENHLRLLFPFGMSADDMASDLRRLVRE